MNYHYSRFLFTIMGTIISTIPIQCLSEYNQYHDNSFVLVTYRHPLLDQFEII